MKYKITAAIMLATTLFTGSSCSGFLDEEMKKQYGPDNVYVNSFGFETAANGLYVLARDEFNTWGNGNTAFTHGNAMAYELTQIATDIVHRGVKTNDPTLKTLQELSYTPTSGLVGSYWNWGYELIGNANLMLGYSENAGVEWTKPTDKAYYQGVARFFRAYAYRYLVYLYGDVSYVESVADQYRVDFVRTPQAEILDKMIEDLKFASSALPKDPSDVEDGKLTKWAAEHLLSEVYLMAGKYAEAEKAADNVINSGYYALTTERFGNHMKKPGDPFYDMFSEDNQNRSSGNRESILVFQLQYKVPGGGGVNVDWKRRAWNPRYWDNKNFVLADTLGGRGLAQLVPLKWWIDTPGFYDANDMRNSECNIKRHWYYNNPASPEYGKEAVVTDASWNFDNQFYPVITKFFFGKDDELAYNGSNKDRMVSRLGETYLLKAEACLRQNNLEGAAEAINAVRVRAHAHPIKASEVSMDFLLDERIRELVGEELRRFTLKRTGKWLERVKKYNSYTINMDEHNLLMPIPQAVIDNNVGADYPQNPGY
ncbi:MAG: RagB/SusD family nutrient uptake outer membrane protein [Mediterranea sp.]|jgi:hypothetical protein|nr:RagB/SusD family nutrient uptake outer membrane protein [Mediterranea sp.]